MEFLIIILLIGLVVFLFTLHVLAKEDLIFVRKNVTLEVLFNLAFFTAFIGLLAARVVFIILHPNIDYINPLVFLLFPYFPGLSLIGGIVGGVLFLFYYAKKKKLPAGRIFDFFGMSLLSALPVGFLGFNLLLGMTDLFSGILMPIIFIAMLFFFVKVLLPLNVRGEIKDSSLGFLFLLVFSFTSLLSRIVRSDNYQALFINIDTILLLILFLFSLAMLVIHERTRARL